MSVDMTRFKKHSGRLDVEGIDFDAFRTDPLDPESLRCLQYMHDVEHHTICYLRDLLLTPAHRDPDVTTFLALWAHEELWHGEAIGAVLDAHDLPSGAARIAPMRRRPTLGDRIAPLTHLIGSFIARDSFVGIHMAWGAVNEWTTQAGYARLSQQADHPVLTELLRRIMRQEGRHIDFYASQAVDRLRDDRWARRLARFALRHLWKPVGAGVMPEAEVAYLISHLFDGEEGRAMAERIDRRVDALPGLDGLHLISGARSQYSLAA